MFQNCGDSFGVMNESQLQSLSCGKSVMCDADGFPVGKIVIEQLPPGDYPSRSFSPSKTYYSLVPTPSGSALSLLRIANLPGDLACPQTWLRGGLVKSATTTAPELLSGLADVPCRLGEGMPQANEGLERLLNSGCFFIETNYQATISVPSLVIDLLPGGSPVFDETMSRARIATARVRFRCELPK